MFEVMVKITFDCLYSISLLSDVGARDQFDRLKITCLRRVGSFLLVGDRARNGTTGVVFGDFVNSI